MQLSVKATAIAAAILWGGGLLFVGLVNRFCPDYGWWFLKAMDSIYPGYHVAFGLKNLLAGVGYAIFDGLVAGAIFAWLYNKVSTCCCCTKKEEETPTE